MITAIISTFSDMSVNYLTSVLPPLPYKVAYHFIFNPLRLIYPDGSLINIQFNLNQPEGFLPLKCKSVMFVLVSFI